MFSRPRKPFDRQRIDDENILVKKYGLKNKREVWKAKTLVSKFRSRAKALIGKDIEEQNIFFDRLSGMGINVNSVADVLALTEENIFSRRLQTVLFKKKLANTPKQARQLIVHKNVLVDGKIVNIPSFVVTKDLENKLSLKEKSIRENVTESGEGNENVESEE